MSYAEQIYTIEELTGVINDAATGVPPANMQTFSAAAGDAKVTLTALEPADTEVDGQLIASCKGFVIVMSTTGYPTNEADGTVVVDHVADGSTLTYEVTGLTNDTQYYFSAFPYTDHGVFNRAAGLRVLAGSHANRVTATPQEYVLYGFKRTKADSNPATRVVATEMAVGLTPASMNTSTGAIDLGGWANAWFVTGNKPCMIKSDGTIDYYLNPDDLNYKEDGVTASDIANTSYDGNAMAIFPTCWVKRWQDDTYEYFNVCNIQLDSDYKAYAHQREDGTIMDWFARSIYDAGVVSSKARSISGLTPCNTVAGGTQLTYAQANGSLWDSDTWSRVALIWDLLTLMSLNDDVQDAWGYGYYTGFSQASHLKASGQGNTKGAFYGKHSQDVVKVFNIENFWGNIWKIMQGLVYNTTGKYGVKMTRPYNTSGSGYTATSFGLSGTSGGYQSAHNMSEYGCLPTTASGSDSTYIPDGAWWNTSQQNFARFGSSGYYGLRVGRALTVYAALSDSSWDYGLALTCEQPLAS